MWINPSQRSGGDYVQQSSFSRDGNNDWSRGGGGGGTPRDVKSSDFSFSSQNRFSALASHTPSEKDAQSSTDDVDTIQKDMEVWQTSGQWPFSCYSVLPGKLSGFVEVSPEELRLEYYSGRASGDLQAYMSSVQQLADQWRSRVQELRSMSSSTRISVISELNNPSLQTSTPGSGFGSTASGFGATSSSSSSSSTGFGAAGFGQGSQSSSTFSFAPSKTGFGAASSTQHASGVVSGVLAQSSSGFGCAPAASASSFSFSEPQASSVSVSSFSFRPSPGESSASAVLQSGSSGVFGADTALFSTHTDLTAEELKEFTSKRFTLGQIPLKPPPADLLVL